MVENKTITLTEIIKNLKGHTDVSDRRNKMFLSMLIHNVLEDINFHPEASEIYIEIEKYFGHEYPVLGKLYSIFLRRNTYTNEHWDFLLENIKGLKENLDRFEKLKNNIITEYKGYTHYDLYAIYEADTGTSIISQMIGYGLVSNEFKEIKGLVKEILS